MDVWDTLHSVGLRSHYLASRLAAKLMIKQKSGLIVNISSLGGYKYWYNVSYGVAKCGLDRMAEDMAVDLAPYGVSTVSLYPGLTSTERVTSPDFSKGTKGTPYENMPQESVEFTGKIIAKLY